MKNSDNSTCCGECIYVSSIRLESWATHLPVGEVAFITRYILPYDATNQKVRWSSSDDSIATVNPDSGLVTAQGVGTVVITATAVDRGIVTGTYVIEVVPYIYVQSLTILNSELTMKAGEHKEIYKTITPANATKSLVKWSSSNECVATVSPFGFVKANKPGEVIITARTTDGTNLSATCKVIVEAVPVEAVTIESSSENMNVGDEIELVATVCPENATNKTIKWHSTNENVATVGTYTGKVSAHKAGTAEIVATTVDGNFVARCTVKVNYCGGCDYKDVTKHTMILQQDGYYVCSKCGYRIKSPALQDKDILSEEDYYRVLSCYLSLPYYSTIENEKGFFGISTETLLSQIDDIRSQSEFSWKYEYKGNDNKYKREYTEESKLVFSELSVAYNEITSTNLWLHNGVAEALIKFAIGFFIPKTYKSLFAAVTSNNIYDDTTFLLSELAEKAGYPEIGIILDLINLGSSENDTITVSDKVVYVRDCNCVEKTQTKIVFSSDGSLKAQYNSRDIITIIA